MPNAARDPLLVLGSRGPSISGIIIGIGSREPRFSLAGNLPNAALSLQATCRRSTLAGSLLVLGSRGPSISGIQIRVRTPLDARSRTRIITTTTLLLI